jgi:enoyl-[acyl-carrier protein] reductase II
MPDGAADRSPAAPPDRRLSRMLGVDIPIIQAPMTYIAGARLAAAVSNAGALGIIETTSPQGREDLKRVRDLTDRPVGANVALAFRQVPDIVEILADAEIGVVTTSAGDPSILTEPLHEAGITVLHVVGTVRAALKAVDAGVDGLIVEGVEGGGFKNLRGSTTFVLLPLVASQVSLPIVAAGGVCDSRSMAAAFVLGAEGVQMGTRMLASAESPVHDNFKASVVRADDTGTVLLSLPGLPTMRVIRTATAEEAASTGRSERGLDAVTTLYFEGDMDASLANTGQVAARIDRVESVADIIATTWNGCLEAIDQARHRLA